MSVQTSEFGTLSDGRSVGLYTLQNRNGLVTMATAYGARWTQMLAPDRTGRMACVTLAFDNLARYLKGDPFFGPTVGRVANRIGGAEFTLDGVSYKLEANSGRHMLHGGSRAWDKQLWAAEPLDAATAVRFRYTSPDGEAGFPGTVKAAVTYTLSDENDLRIDYEATTDKPTAINLTNHAYFNLKGAGAGSVLEHVVQIHADQYTPSDKDLIPTGAIEPVKGGPLDFTSPRSVGSRIGELPGPGYDHNYVLRGGGGLRPAARVIEPISGRILEIATTEPGVQFYTANYLDGSVSGIGGAYPKHGGFCLECQHFPDAVHHANFPSIILRPGQTYRQTTVHRFCIE